MALGVATEILVGVVPFLLLLHYNVSAEAALPIVITQFPAVIVGFILMIFETPENASQLDLIITWAIALLQTALFAYAWFRFLTRSGHAISASGNRTQQFPL